MAEGVLYSVFKKIISELGTIALGDIEVAGGVKKELKKLENTLITIKDLLIHAEELQLKNPDQVTPWLGRIKDVAYEAEDVIDEFIIEALQWKLVVRGNIIGMVCNMVCNFFSCSNPLLFHYKMAKRIKEIQENMKEIRDDRSFYLERRDEVMRLPNPARENTHSYINESEVFGREDAKEEIVKSLLQFDVEEKLSIVSIQGIAGLGKTTLAKLVRNDKRVQSNFDLIMWVCVTEDFDVKNIVEKTIKSATNDSCPNLEMDQLQYRLRKSLERKKFLLVLDDVWNEDDKKWEELKNLFLGGANGSKLMVTTRSAKVAEIIRSDSPHSLSKLSDDDCWKLFRSRAFKRGQEQENPNLVKIGREIVKKCGGVPMAVRSVGSLMYSKTLEHEWEQIKNSDVWKDNDILPSLRLNYNSMSSSLKQCFTYCSTLSKGVTFGKEPLVQVWIGLGFISCCGENQSLEDIGLEYIKTLTWISFLQEDLYRNESVLTMHDLAYDLAQSIAGEECLCVQKGKEERIPDRLRNLCVVGESIALEGLPKKSNLRTLVYFSPCELLFVENICSSFKFLRVLALQLSSNTENLPTSICKLRHLRVLQFYSRVNITVTLPESIVKLQRLQTIQCSGPLTVKELPRNLHLLSELRHIVLWNGASASYSHMPSGLGQLTSIQTLSAFVVGKGKGCKLNELNGLKRLRGKLVIQNLENVKSARDSENANLKDKPNLEELELVWNEPEIEEACREDIHVDVLKTLQPHQHLKRLSIDGYKGDMFPGWLMADPPLLTNLVKVSLKMGGKCEHLPPFGELQSLEFLELREMHDLRFIDVERTNKVRGGSHQNFPKLKELILKNFHKLESWATTEEESFADSLPCLVKLSISSCPKLTAMPLLPSLENCVLEECSEKLVHSMLQQQQQLIARNNPNPSSSHSSSSSTFEKATLKYLEIKACKDLVCLSNHIFQGCSSLLKLKITDCECLTTLSDLWHLRALEILRLINCRELHMLEGTDGLSSLQEFLIREIPKLVSIPEGLRSSTTLRYFSINSEGLMDLPEWLGNLTSLEMLQLVGCKNLKMTWPNGLRNLKSLRYLSICPSSSLLLRSEDIQYLSTALLLLNLFSFEDLPEWLRNFTSLQSLSIRFCPNLECLPGWMSRLTALQELEIFSCDHLTSRCQKDTGVDWHVIAHIPTIVIDEVVIQ